MELFRNNFSKREQITYILYFIGSYGFSYIASHYLIVHHTPTNWKYAYYFFSIVSFLSAAFWYFAGRYYDRFSDTPSLPPSFFDFGSSFYFFLSVSFWFLMFIVRLAQILLLSRVFQKCISFFLIWLRFHSFDLQSLLLLP